MSCIEQPKVESEDLSDFVRIMETARRPLTHSSPDGQEGGRINIDPGKVKNGLAQLVLTLIKLIHNLLERQAIKRIDSGSLSDEEIERVGLTLMKQAEELERIGKMFDLEDNDLNIDLGPLGKLL